MKLYDDNGKEITNPKILNFLSALEELAGDTLQEQKEDDYSDIELYDDDGTRVTNPITLRAIRDSDRIIAEWERRYAG
ncbi:MAG: hypothetical protein IJS28_02660 [Synergistaceae bacterium]|nr:hypothetical protein [Synergistaceae bacterium]